MLMNTKSSSEYLFEKFGIRRAPRTLRNLRYMGGGPAYRRGNFTEVVYESADLDRWVESLLTPAFSNTTEESNANPSEPRLRRTAAAHQ